MTTSQPAVTKVFCSNCRRPYPEDGIPYRCPVCKGHFDYPVFPEINPTETDPSQPGIWRYRHTFGLPDDAPMVSLGEGNTPLIWSTLFGRKVAFKLEFLNPTGSYKDRGSAVLASFLKSRGASEAVEDSSGNAGASFAAYAAVSGIGARIYIPDYASGPKCKQIEAYGAEVVRIPGSRARTTEAVLEKVNEGAIYGSHAYMPHGLAGYATLAYEIHQQIGGAPNTIILPVGQGGLLLGVGRGFFGLKQAGLIDKIPTLIGVQAMACAPLWALFSYGSVGMGWVSEGETLAEGVRVSHPLRGDAVLQLVLDSGGLMVAVEENEILPGRSALAHVGFYVEPTSAIVWNGLAQIIGQAIDPIVVILTGAGLKTL